jgi:PAS domain S-box-containing protein
MMRTERSPILLAHSMRISGIPREPRSLAFHVLLAGGSASAAFLVNVFFLELTNVGSIPLFLAAVVICAWFAGALSAIICTIISSPMVMVISQPRWELSLDDGDDWIRIALLGAVSLMVIALDRVRRGAEKLELESQVALLENEERLRVALSAGRMGTFEWDIPSQRIHWSAEIEEIRGAESGQDFEGTILEFLQMVHEEDREPLQRAVAGTLAAGAPDLDVEYRARVVDGAVHWFSAKGSVLRDAAGQPVRISGVAWDTTARKQAELALRTSEAQTRLILDSALDAIVSMDANGVVTAWNPQAEETFGFSADEAIGRTVAELIVPEQYREAHREGLERFLRTAAGPVLNTRVEMTALHREGREFPVELAIVPVGEGKEATFSAFVRDITLRKRAEEALRESEERFRAMANTAPVLIWVAGPDNLGAWFNRPWLDFRGRTLEQELGAGWTEGIHADDIGDAIATCQEAFEVREEFRMEFRMRRHDGEYRWMLDHGIPRFGAEGEFLGYIGSCIDVTEQKLAEERARFLADASAVVASTLDLDESLNRIARLIVPRIADFCVIDLLSENGRFERLAMAYKDPAREAAIWDVLRKYPPGGKQGHLALRALADKKSQVADTPDLDRLTDAVAQDEEHRRAIHEIQPRTSLVVPLVTREAVVGTMTLTAADPAGRFGPDEVRLLENLAERAALAVENARLYGKSQEARERQQFLVDSGAALAASLELDETLNQAARLPVPALGDFCVLQLTDEAGALGPVVLFAADPEIAVLLEEFQRKYPDSVSPSSLRSRAVSERQTQFVPELDDTMLIRLAQNEEQLDLLRRMQVKGAVAIPLIAHGEVIGAVTLAVTGAGGRRYTRADVLAAEGYAQRAAFAIQNARLYHESQETQEELRKANAVKDEFLGMVSHELRTPVTTMYSGARLLLARFDELDDAVKRDVIRDVENESERLQLIIENLLALARQEEGQKVQPEPVSVKRAVDTALRRVSKQRPSRRLEWEPGEQPHYISCVPIYLDLVLRNVIDNADKYSPPDQPIEVRTESENGVVLIRVRDHGPGVPEAEAEKIFDRFYRAAQTSRATSGAGIGLAVCRRLIETQGGTIDLRNAEGGGLEITVCLPAYKQNE